MTNDCRNINHDGAELAPVLAFVGRETEPRTRKRFLRLAEVKNVTGLSRSTIYEEIAAGEFPRPINITGRCVAWIESEVHQWMDLRIQLSRNLKRTA